VLSLIKRYRELLVVGALLLYPFATFLTRGQTSREPNVVDRAVLAATSPLQQAFGWVIGGVSGGWTGYVDLRGVREENERLRGENQALNARVHSLTEAELQNTRLRQLLGYAEERTGDEVAARVIGVNPVSTLLSVRLDRGEDHGVVRGSSVVTTDGVVGRVVRTTGAWSDVVLVTDPNARTAVRVQRSRARATAAGMGGDRPLLLENLLRTEDLVEGDVLLTSGTDGVFPPGLVVGTATELQARATGMFQSADVVPAVDMTRLEEVLVLPPVEWRQELPVRREAAR
jgi:rod shape-determining protein MreC